MPRVFSLSPTHQAGELIDAFRRKLQSDALSFGLLLIIRKFMEYALHWRFLANWRGSTQPLQAARPFALHRLTRRRLLTQVLGVRHHGQKLKWNDGQDINKSELNARRSRTRKLHWGPPAAMNLSLPQARK
jgi:hypothetical protein